MYLFSFFAFGLLTLCLISFFLTFYSFLFSFLYFLIKRNWKDTIQNKIQYTDLIFPHVCHKLKIQCCTL